MFSDGTGNSSAKLFKTNIWRLYEAVDLGPPQDGVPAQIAFYSNGVGTSEFRPLALLAGIFGVGLKSNVLALYRFLCRNWMSGDEIFLFGFSRGAFTIRLLTGLIARQGILRDAAMDRPPDEDRIAYLARAAYRAYAGEVWPNRWPARAAARIVRRMRDGAVELHRRLTGRLRYDPAHNGFTDIAFVGAWDTVAAYGGPVIEITRGIDDWIWPLTMPNYELSPRVAKARHALALDDERDAFQPLLWDEVREAVLIRWGGHVRVNGCDGLHDETRRVADGRLRQVWFAGMHGDVGGGYPDESLSFVSLLWMIEELDGAVRLLPDAERRIAATANAYGPIHDSRAGLRGYYRYQPRRIAALVDWRWPACPRQAALARTTRAMRDPHIADPDYVLAARPGEDPSPETCALAHHVRGDHGLLTAVRVHESVIDRIGNGTDDYAPIGLPQRFGIVPARHGRQPGRTLAAAAALRDEASPGDDVAGVGGGFDGQARTWDMVRVRRTQYFASALLWLLLLAMPLWGRLLDRSPVRWIRVDAGCIVRPVLSRIDRISGGLAGPWIDVFSRHLLVVLLLGAALALLRIWRRSYDVKLRGRVRRSWRAALGCDGAGAAWREGDRGGLARLRDGDGYQRLSGWIKWRAAPAIAGWSLIGAAGFLLAALIARLLPVPLDGRGDLPCRDPAAFSVVKAGADVCYRGCPALQPRRPDGRGFYSQPVRLNRA